MVVRVVGDVNGSQIIFQRSEGDEWLATVPKDLNGEYIIALDAVADAGNSA